VIGIVMKGVTNPNCVLSGVTCTIIRQNRARTPNIVQYYKLVFRFLEDDISNPEALFGIE
jgi:hypothetical protein